MRRLLAAMSVVAVALLAGSLAGCDSGGSGPTDPTASSPTALPPTSASPNPSPSPSPSPTDGGELIGDSLDALYTDTSSFHVAGTIPEYDVTVDLRFGENRTVVGTVARGGAGAEIEMRQVTDGTLYVKGTAQFYADVKPGAGPDLSGLAGRWVVVDDDSPAPLDLLPDYANKGTALYAGGLDQRKGKGTYEITGPKPVSGRSVYVVEGFYDTYLIAATGPPLPIDCTNSRGEGRLRFDRYDEPFTVTAPPAAEIVAVPTS